MQATFFQKFILTIVSGFFAACLVWFYINIVERANNDINGGYEHSVNLKTSRR